MNQIALINVTNRDEYTPRACQMFNESKWNETKELAARVLKQTNDECRRRPLQWIMDRFVAGDFPTAEPREYCNALTCLANSGEHNQQRGYFYPLNYELQPDSYAFFYEAKNGEICAAVSSEDVTQYYKIVELDY